MSSAPVATRNRLTIVTRVGVVLGIVAGVAGILALRAARQDGARSAPRAEFGVLYGGDIQDRERFTLELEPNRTELGLRVTFGAPVVRETRIDWEIEKPSSVRGLDGRLARAAELGKIVLQPGERRADARFGFRKGDLPGSWRVRVSVDGTNVLDRPFEVVSPVARDAARNKP
jgi:hypothetical protein